MLFQIVLAKQGVAHRKEARDRTHAINSPLFHFIQPQKVSENGLPILFLLFLMRNTLPLALNNAREECIGYLWLTQKTKEVIQNHILPVSSEILLTFYVLVYECSGRNFETVV